jgi:hypothetical protein
VHGCIDNQIAKILDEVVGKAVVVINQQQHGVILSRAGAD